jgi:tetratricopeptide (TPR) repeat protein
VLVFVGLVALFAATGSFASVYHAERLQRAETHYQRGEQLAKSGSAADAAEEYRAALTFAPNDSRYRLALARSLMDLGRLDEAEAHLIGLHDADPDNALIDLLLARVAARQGRIDQAVAQYHQAIYGLWPEDPAGNRLRTRFELVSLLSKSGQPGHALAELLSLANEAPDDPATEQRIANLLVHYGAPQRAGELFERVAQKQPDNTQAIEGAGEASFAQGDYAAAAGWFRRALKLDPNAGQARARLDEIEHIEALDPTLVSLSAAVRYERSRTLLEKTLASLEACTQGRPAPAAAQPLITSAHEFLQSSRRRREGDTPRAIELAEQIWATRTQECGKPGAAEEPLDLVMTKVAK